MGRIALRAGMVSWGVQVVSAYDSVHFVRDRMRVRVYVEPPVTRDYEYRAVMIQISHPTDAKWGQVVDLSPQEARDLADGLLKAVERFEHERDKP